VVHIHGKLFESRCAADCGRPAFADRSDYSEGELPRCGCRALVRPNVCWFGEQPYHLGRIDDALQRCEVFIAIGTSGSVQPVASFVTMLKQKPRPARTVFLGLTEPSNAKYFDEIHLGPAAELVPQAVGSLSKLLRQD
jgi:NAD-dependent deacetylase